jgi:hypothetical protein
MRGISPYGHITAMLKKKFKKSDPLAHLTRQHTTFYTTKKEP